jgi:hypothetical protein
VVDFGVTVGGSINEDIHPIVTIDSIADGGQYYTAGDDTGED